MKFLSISKKKIKNNLIDRMNSLKNSSLLFSLKWLQNNYKKVFLFYRKKGLRSSQTYQGELHENQLLIACDETKQRIDEELFLSITNLQGLTDMKYHVEGKYKSLSQKSS